MDKGQATAGEVLAQVQRGAMVTVADFGPDLIVLVHLLKVKTGAEQKGMGL